MLTSDFSFQISSLPHQSRKKACGWGEVEAVSIAAGEAVAAGVVVMVPPVGRVGAIRPAEAGAVAGAGGDERGAAVGSTRGAGATVGSDSSARAKATGT